MSAKNIYSAFNLGLKQIIKRNRNKTTSFNALRHYNQSKSSNSRSSSKSPLERAEITKTFPTSHQSLTIGFQNKVASDFKYIWLRDNCQCSKCIHPENRQKVLDTVSLDINIKPITFYLGDDGVLQIVWPDKNGGDHVSSYTADWLYKYGKGFKLDQPIEDELPPMVTWNKDKISKIKPEISYDEVMNTEEGLNTWLEMIYKYGIALMKGVPCVKNEVINVVERFAYVKKTKWGSSFDVLCEPVQSDPSHLAFSGMYLEHHTDMNYLEKSPGLQALHCLKANSAEDGMDEIGGQSFFVDGYYVAEWLQKKHPASFHALTSTLVKFKILSHNMEYSNTHNVICANKVGDVLEIHYNTRTMAPLDAPSDTVQAFYEAYKLFGQKMRDPSSEFSFNLAPGDLVAFNNRRILHGRTQFDPSRISRHLQGCYGDIDEVITRYKTNVRDQELKSEQQV